MVATKGQGMSSVTRFAFRKLTVLDTFAKHWARKQEMLKLQESRAKLAFALNRVSAKKQSEQYPEWGVW